MSLSLRKSAAFSLVLVALAAGNWVPSPPWQTVLPLTVGGAEPAAVLTSRGDRGAEARNASPRSLAFANPLYTDPDDRFSKDPAVIEHEGKYYVYYFGFTPRGRQAIEVASSEDLIGWRYEGVALEARKDDGWDADLIWAPDVAFRDGQFYMYYTGGRTGADGDIDWSTMRIGLATSREPTGSFVRSTRNPILTPPFGNGVIDPEFFADDDGKDYLYYVVQDQAPEHWEGIRVQRVADMVRLYDDAKVIDPTVDWEENIVEAPTVFKANGYYYLLYSGGGSEYGQNVGYAFSRAPMASGKAGDRGWVKYPEDTAPQALIERGEKWADIAVGSTSLFRGPGRQLYVFFQGKSQTDGKFRLGMIRLLVGGP